MLQFVWVLYNDWMLYIKHVTGKNISIDIYLNVVSLQFAVSHLSYHTQIFAFLFIFNHSFLQFSVFFHLRFFFWGLWGFVLGNGKTFWGVFVHIIENCLLILSRKSVYFIVSSKQFFSFFLTLCPFCGFESVLNI